MAFWAPHDNFVCTDMLHEAFSLIAVWIAFCSCARLQWKVSNTSLFTCCHKVENCNNYCCILYLGSIAIHAVSLTVQYTVACRSKDTLCKDNLDVRTEKFGTTHCTLTAKVLLSKDNLVWRQFSWEQTQSFQTEFTVLGKVKTPCDELCLCRYRSLTAMRRKLLLQQIMKQALILLQSW